jgi:hypothetical protein
MKTSKSKAENIDVFETRATELEQVMWTAAMDYRAKVGDLSNRIFLCAVLFLLDKHIMRCPPGARTEAKRVVIRFLNRIPEE